MSFFLFLFILVLRCNPNFSIRIYASGSHIGYAKNPISFSTRTHTHGERERGDLVPENRGSFAKHDRQLLVVYTEILKPFAFVMRLCTLQEEKILNRYTGATIAFIITIHLTPLNINFRRMCMQRKLQNYNNSAICRL